MVLVTLSYERARYGGHRSLPAHSAYTPGAFSRARHCCQVLQWQRLSDRLAVRVIVLYGGLLIEVNGKHDKQYCRHSTSLPLPRRLCDFTMRLHVIQRTVSPRSFCPSVRLSLKRVLWQNERNVCLMPHEKSLVLVFWQEDRLMGRPILPEIWAKLTLFERKRRFLINISF